ACKGKEQNKNADRETSAHASCIWQEERPGLWFPFRQLYELSNILVEQGTDTSRLLIAFTGFQGALTMPPYDFFAASGHLGASRILLRDSTHLLYFRGCPPDAPGFHVLLERLKSEIARLSPERITCAGTSSGGFAALLFGYLLGADRVHAFAPTIYGSVWLTLLHRDWHQLRNSVSPNHLMRELLIPPSLWKYR